MCFGCSNSVSARHEFLGLIDSPLFENLGVIDKFRGSIYLLYWLPSYLSIRPGSANFEILIK